MKSIALLVLIGMLSLLQLRAATAYGSLSNFDVVNDTTERCYGFEIELEDLRSTDITYTYNWNHYGAPRISEDLSDPAHPKTFVRYESKKNPDGSFASYTNPQDPANPLKATNGHAFTNPSVNLGGEHFGVGYRRAPGIVRYHWLIENPIKRGEIVLGPSVSVATPRFNYVPPAPGVQARAQVVVEPPEPPEPRPERWGVPVWVKVFKTVQPSGKKIKLRELLADDETKPDDKNWDGEEAAETEIEWSLFQKRPANKPGEDRLEAADDLPNGDETVTRRYEFYEYTGALHPEDGEALCTNPRTCPEAVGKYIGSQMAGFNVEEPLGLIDSLQDGALAEPYVPRTLVSGGKPPYAVSVASGGLPGGLSLDPATGVVSGIPTNHGQFSFVARVTDAESTSVTNSYTLRIAREDEIEAGLRIVALDRTGKLTWQNAVSGAGVYRIETKPQWSSPWTVVPGLSVVQGVATQLFAQLPRTNAAFYRVVWTDPPAPQPPGVWVYEGFDDVGNLCATGAITITATAPLAGSATFQKVLAGAKHPNGTGQIGVGSSLNANQLSISLPAGFGVDAFQLTGQMAVNQFWGNWIYRAQGIGGDPVALTIGGRFSARKQ